MVLTKKLYRKLDRKKKRMVNFFFFVVVQKQNLNCLATIQIQEISFCLIKYYYFHFSYLYQKLTKIIIIYF